MKKIEGSLIVLMSVAVIIGASTYIFASNEVASMTCDNGVVNIGDLDLDVQDKCGEPDSQNMNEWKYNFGPSLPVYTVIFNDSKVVHILEDEQGN